MQASIDALVRVSLVYAGHIQGRALDVSGLRFIQDKHTWVSANVYNRLDLGLKMGPRCQEAGNGYASF